MFGYITADRSALDEETLQRYQGCYCGLCRTLQKKHGFLGRMALNYDMTFLVLVLSSLYEPEESISSGRCPVHPVKQRDYWTSSFTDYAADMTVLLGWWNARDDWEDDKKISRLAFYKALGGKIPALEQQYPRQAQAIRENLQQLQRFEAGPEVSADRAANAFGDLMGALFVPREEDHWAPTLRRMGQALGRFIYMMDACMDYEEDRRKGRPNPLLVLDGDTRSREADYQLLTMLLGECTRAFETLPMVQDMSLMRNILYAGVWQKYNQHFSRRDKRGREEGANRP